MALNWKIFTQRPYIQSLSLEEQIRLFNIANEKSIRLRESKFQDFANSKPCLPEDLFVINLTGSIYS